MVVTRNKPPKHKARDVFIVTNATPQAVTMQKLDNLFSTATTLRPKLHTTAPHLLRTLHRVYHLPQQADHTEAITAPSSSPPPWSPISPAYYQQQEDPEEEEEVLENDCQRIIQPMHNWLQEQRQATAAARQDGQNAIAAYIPPPPPPPPPRQAKIAAIQAMAQLAARPKQAVIPQVEVAKPTPETSPESSLFIHHLSPREPWSPLLSYADFQEIHRQ